MFAAANLPTEPLREVFIGRQPILDKDHGLVGYELLFRPTASQEAPLGDARAATADVVCKAFAQLGLSNVLGSVLTFVNVDASFLADDAVEALPKEMVVFEITREVMADAAAVARCRELKALGYQFALSGIIGIDEHVRSLLDLASYFKVDVNIDPPERLQNIASELKTARRTLVACRVESQQQMGLCALLGFQLFQGFYFAKPDVIEGRSLDASTQHIFRLLKLIAGDAEVDELEKAFRVDPALVIHLLRLTNSVGVGARVRISSVRHAITVLGRRQLQRWLQLLLFARGKSVDLQHNPLMQYAALRGRFMELLVERLHRERRDLRDPAFIIGLMSVMPAALSMSMTDILTQISVDNEVRLALSRREGTLGQLLAIIDAYDDNDIPTLQAQLARHGGSVHFGMLVEILTESLAWVQQLDKANE